MLIRFWGTFQWNCPSTLRLSFYPRSRVAGRNGAPCHQLILPGLFHPPSKIHQRKGGISGSELQDWFPVCYDRSTRCQGWDGSHPVDFIDGCILYILSNDTCQKALQTCPQLALTAPNVLNIWWIVKPLTSTNLHDLSFPFTKTQPKHQKSN